MPYISPSKRKKIDAIITKLFTSTADVGSLNYAITRLCLNYVILNGLCYESLNSIAGVLQKVMAEFDESISAPYEYKKMTLNGDIEEYVYLKKLIDGNN